MKFLVSVTFILLAPAFCVNEVSRFESLDMANLEIEEAGKVVMRSEESQKASMDARMKSMTVQKAVGLLKKSQFNQSRDLVKITGMLLKGKRSFRSSPTGYEAVDGARDMLNGMIYKSYQKYDGEIMECTEFYHEHCALMETCRGEISAANFIAANSRELILDAQTTINRCEVDIPTAKYEREQLILQCDHEITEMKKRLAIVMGDIEVMTNILEMTDCEANAATSGLLQDGEVNMYKCVDKCTKEAFVEFEHSELQATVAQLRSKSSRKLMHESIRDLVDGAKGLEVSYEYLQGGVDQPVINQTNFTNKPLPRTDMPDDPCTEGPEVPSMKHKRAAKCVLSGANCYKLQERFLLIQSGIQDERDDLNDRIAKKEEYCEKSKELLSKQIERDEEMEEQAQTQLAAATTKEADAAEEARKTAEKHDKYDKELKDRMKKCNDNYIDFEGEICALKKIRGELYKLQGGGHSTFFQDCEVSKWDPEDCSESCGGGTQKLYRSILVHPQDGAKCLPRQEERGCNHKPCPVDCHLEAWTGWSKCSAECGGGVEQRIREVKIAARFDGNPCGKTSETRACNTQACEKDCELSTWSKWSTCSKDCDGGTKKRTKYVKVEPEGAGDCPDEWSVKRLEYKGCNKHMCLDPEIGSDCSAAGLNDDKFYSCSTLPQCCDGYSGMGTEAQMVQCMKDSTVSDSTIKVTCAGKMYKRCNEPLDVVLLIDGSGSLGETGWKASLVAADRFVDSFAYSGPTPEESHANMAVILFSGPPTWSGVYKCMDKSDSPVNMETDCKIKTVTHFTHDMTHVKTEIAKLTWPQGSTLTSLALMTAKSELSLGRKDSQSVIVIITDGRPLSYRKTWFASRSVRKSARLVWVPVTQYAPLKFIKLCATRRWEENVVQVDSFYQLEQPQVITTLVADICPDKDVVGYDHWR
jgi:hypothetical protein